MPFPGRGESTVFYRMDPRDCTELAGVFAGMTDRFRFLKIIYGKNK
jgi:hypothetical protein